jgi:hypothetical protein
VGVLRLLDNVVVVFTENNARILHNPEDLSAYESMPNAVINPDLTGVIKVPPHLWQLKDGLVLRLHDSEIPKRIEDVAFNGTINTFIVGTGIEPDPKPINLLPLVYAITYTALVIAIMKYIL